MSFSISQKYFLLSYYFGKTNILYDQSVNLLCVKVYPHQAKATCFVIAFGPIFKQNSTLLSPCNDEKIKLLNHPLLIFSIHTKVDQIISVKKKQTQYPHGSWPFHDLTGTIPPFHYSVPEVVNGGTVSGGHLCHRHFGQGVCKESLFWERPVTKEPVAL